MAAADSGCGLDLEVGEGGSDVVVEVGAVRSGAQQVLVKAFGNLEVSVNRCVAEFQLQNRLTGVIR